jgi:AraC-like DNA-binding protein
VRSIFGFSASVILDQSALLTDLAPGAEALHQRLASTENLEARHSAIEDWIRNALAARTMRDREVIEACRLLTGDPSIGVSALATRFGWNERTLHRQFRAAVGYGPKHFSRIMRVQKAIHAAEHATGRLAEVAQAAGYADQAHMTRDFRDITGFTPKNALQSAHPEVSSWMDAGW